MRKQRTSQEDTTSDLCKFQKLSTGSSVERNDQRYNTQNFLELKIPRFKIFPERKNLASIPCNKQTNKQKSQTILMKFQNSGN